MADPLDSCLFAESPVSITPPADEDYRSAFSQEPNLAVPAPDGYATYNSYEFSVRFTNRPYVIFPNERLTLRNLDFYDTDGTLKKLYYYREWLRFCHSFSAAVDTRVSASVAAAMRFRAPTNAAINNTPLTAVPEMQIPDTMIIFRWYAVPQRYVTHSNSFLMKYKGFINQTQFMDWEPGQLLYVGTETLRTYNQVDFQPAEIGQAYVLGTDRAPVLDVDDESELAGTFGGNTVVDLEMKFILTNRPSPEVIPIEDTPNGNWIPFHHNLLPHFQTKSFQYATADKNDKVDWVPSYLSIPFEILWGDPDWDGHILTP